MVIFSEGLAKVAEQYLKKGAKVYIEGALQTRKWTDQYGVEKYSTEDRAAGLQRDPDHARRPRGGGAGRRWRRLWRRRHAAIASVAVGPARAPQRRVAAAPAGGRSDMDDDIPF